MKLEISGAASPQTLKSAIPAAAPAVATVDLRRQSQPAPLVSAAPALTKPSAEDLSLAVNDINQSLQFLSKGLVFSVDEASNRQIVKLVDTQTNEVIRQFPTEQALQLAKVLDQVLGKLLNEKA